MTYAIVPARPADVPMLPAIELAAAWLLAAHAPASVLAEQTDEQVLRRAQREGRLWVALEHHRPVGFAHGRRGLGRQLVSAVCRWAAEGRYRSVTLTTFRDVPWNMPFYARLGFEELPARRDRFPPPISACAFGAPFPTTARSSLTSGSARCARRTTSSRRTTS